MELTERLPVLEGQAHRKRFYILEHYILTMKSCTGQTIRNEIPAVMEMIGISWNERRPHSISWVTLKGLDVCPPKNTKGVLILRAIVRRLRSRCPIPQNFFTFLPAPWPHEE